MTDLSKHAAFLLQLLANEGPLPERGLHDIFERLGPGAAIRMEDALRRLIRTGNVLAVDSPLTYYVAPARLLYKQADPPTFELVGHPGAEQLLRFYGKVVGPDPQGVRHFILTADLDDLERRLAEFGISVGGMTREPD